MRGSPVASPVPAQVRWCGDLGAAGDCSDFALVERSVKTDEPLGTAQPPGVGVTTSTAVVSWGRRRVKSTNAQGAA
jgi:hypothetical protein